MAQNPDLADPNREARCGGVSVVWLKKDTTKGNWRVLGLRWSESSCSFSGSVVFYYSNLFYIPNSKTWLFKSDVVPTQPELLARNAQADWPGISWN